MPFVTLSYRRTAYINYRGKLSCRNPVLLPHFAFGNSCLPSHILWDVLQLIQYFIFASALRTYFNGMSPDIFNSVFCAACFCYLGSKYAHDTSRLGAQSGTNTHQCGMFPRSYDVICLYAWLVCILQIYNHLRCGPGIWHSLQWHQQCPSQDLF